MQRQMVRTRFALSQRPRLVTNILIGINVAIYVVLAILSQNPFNIDPNVLLQAGAQTSSFGHGGEYWRIFTAMFLHFSITHIGLNMLSLFFVGSAVEVMYGKWRYLLIYLASGIVGGIVTHFVTPDALAAGASGAIFGVFGALGVFYIVNRQALGAYGRGAIGNWLFWIGLNLVFGFSIPGIGIWDHIGGLIAGMLLGFLLMPRLGGERSKDYTCTYRYTLVLYDTHLACWITGYTECRKLSLHYCCDVAESRMILSMPFTHTLGFLASSGCVTKGYPHLALLPELQRSRNRPDLRTHHLSFFLTHSPSNG